MFVFGIIVIKVWHTEFPVWAFCLSLAIGMSLRLFGIIADGTIP